MLLFCLRQPQTQKPLGQLAEIKGYERINIAFIRQRLVADDRQQKEQDRPDIAVEAKQRRQDQIQDPHEFQRISQLIVLLCIIGDGHERHIQHDLTVEPAAVDRELSQHQTGHHA